ncbi:MAG TPA: type I restriction endonuclease subunit R, partial [Methylomirabilota bacterium]|nr:type I restriction endonuclease subunit R [Methylomirabilota bacterium]
LQKFPVIAEEVVQLAGKRFAVIIDEAHSSQTGEDSRKLKKVLAAATLDGAEREDTEEEEDLADRIVADMRARGRLTNVSYFAFTATPKEKTLELFGVQRDDGKFEAFSLYSMRQAIEERFILDVLENYTTYKVYWKLLKKAADDPHYDKQKASYLLRAFVDLHPHAIDKKIAIMVEHFHGQVAHRIGGRAKAMIVTRSRLHAVRYKIALDSYLTTHGFPYKALVAFSGTVQDGGVEYTESRMNGSPEAQTAGTFDHAEYRFLVVAEKFQTGFDQPLLHTMYVDKKLGGLNAVQTLSRLNRVHPEKAESMVLDFTNDADEIQKAFQPYYEKTLLSEATDPNLLYDLQRRLLDFHLYSEDEVDAFARLYFAPKTTQDQLYAALGPIADRFQSLTDAQQAEFRGQLTDYVRLYAFLSHILPFTDADLEKLYVFGRLLRRYLPVRHEDLPREIQQKIDMESYRIKQTRSGKVDLERGQVELEPVGAKGSHPAPEEEAEALSRIIRELNERFGTDFAEEDRVFIRQLEEKLAADPALTASVRSNAPENARLTFDHVVSDRLQDMVDTNFKFYKRITDDREFAKFFLDWLFDRFRTQVTGPSPTEEGSPDA